MEGSDLSDGGLLTGFDEIGGRRLIGWRPLH